MGLEVGNHSRDHLESLFEPVPVPTPNQRVNVDSLGLRLRRVAGALPISGPSRTHPAGTPSPGVRFSWEKPALSGAQDLLDSALGHVVMWSVSA